MDLVKDPIPLLIRRIAIPASVGFFFNTMYNVVDTFYAGQHSEDALAALSLSFPIFFIVIAIGAGVGQGATALIANAIGESKPDEGHHYSLQAVSFGIALSVVLTFLGLACAPWMFRTLGAEAAYLQLCLEYMNVILLGTVFFLLQSIANASLNAQGDTTTYRNVLIAGFLANCVLDPWFMYGGLGVPAMGVGGIALATVLIQATGCTYIAWKATHTRIWRGFRWSLFRPNFGKYARIAEQGFPASINMLTVAIGIFVITKFVSFFGKEGVAAYGVATRIEQIFLLPTIGLNIAVLSLTGQNNGARQYDRIREALATTIRYGLFLSLAGGVLLLTFSEPMMRVFTDSEEIATIGARYLRIAAITLFSYVILFQTVFMLQGLKRPMYAIWIGIYRQFVAPCVVFYVLAFRMDWQLDGIWWGVFLVTWSAAVFTWFYGRRKLRRVQDEHDALVAAVEKPAS